MNSRMRVLMHSCCGPCSVYPADALAAEGFELRLFFYNPNVQPYREYSKRLDAVVRFADKRGLPLIVEDDYDPEGWLRMVAFRETERCRLCYSRRLEAAAGAARRGKFDAFTTTLLYSRRQKHELIRELAEAVAEDVGVPFLYRDFRKGWKAGIQGSKAMGLYRQEYCGCIFSERDRFQKLPQKEKLGGRA
jgi:predicted adenine nucleotide alpha hydrolase (AANH) superfamily ATPase